MKLADNEPQASETQCTEVCWTNYTRRVRRGKTSVVKFEALVESMKLKFQKRSA